MAVNYRIPAPMTDSEATAMQPFAPRELAPSPWGPVDFNDPRPMHTGYKVWPNWPLATNPNSRQAALAQQHAGYALPPPVQPLAPESMALVNPGGLTNQLLALQFQKQQAEEASFGGFFANTSGSGGPPQWSQQPSAHVQFTQRTFNGFGHEFYEMDEIERFPTFGSLNYDNAGYDNDTIGGGAVAPYWTRTTQPPYPIGVPRPTTVTTVPDFPPVAPLVQDWHTQYQNAGTFPPSGQSAQTSSNTDGPGQGAVVNAIADIKRRQDFAHDVAFQRMHNRQRGINQIQAAPMVIASEDNGPPEQPVSRQSATTATETMLQSALNPTGLPAQSWPGVDRFRRPSAAFLQPQGYGRRGYGVAADGRVINFTPLPIQAAVGPATGQATAQVVSAMPDLSKGAASAALGVPAVTNDLPQLPTSIGGSSLTTIGLGLLGLKILFL